MGMTKLALAVIRMPRHMTCVLVMMLMPTATLIVIMLFMLVMVLVPTATVVVLMLPMPVMMLLVPAATLIVIMLIVLMVMMLMLLLYSVLIATAAFIMMLCCMLMRMAAAITMAMLRDMPHAAMIVVLATVTTGTAFGMVAIIFIPLNMSVHMSKAAHLFRGVTHFF